MNGFFKESEHQPSKKQKEMIKFIENTIGLIFEGKTSKEAYKFIGDNYGIALETKKELDKQNENNGFLSNSQQGTIHFLQQMMVNVQNDYEDYIDSYNVNELDDDLGIRWDMW